MSWQIDLFRVPPGVDPRVVRDVQYGDAPSDDYAVPAASAETDAWIRHALGLLERVAPGLKLADASDGDSVSFDDDGHIEHVCAWQPDGPLLVNLYPGCADVRISRGHAETRDGEHFEALWRACKILAEEAECAVFPQYDDEPVDTSYDVDEARRIYDDWA